MSEMKMPGNLITADELSEKLSKHGCPLSGKQIKELALQDKLPYFLWVVPSKNGKSRASDPLFQLTPMKMWMMENGWLSQREGEHPIQRSGEIPFRDQLRHLQLEFLEMKKTLKLLLALNKKRLEDMTPEEREKAEVGA